MMDDSPRAVGTSISYADLSDRGEGSVGIVSSERAVTHWSSAGRVIAGESSTRVIPSPLKASRALAMWPSRPEGVGEVPTNLVDVDIRTLSGEGWLGSSAEPATLHLPSVSEAAATGYSDTGALEFPVSRPLRSYYAPPPKWLGRYRHLRTARVRKLLESLPAIILSKAFQSGLAVYRPVIDVEADPEEGTSQIVVRVYVDASPAQTMAFWDSLDIELGRWLTRLDENDSRTVLQDIGIRFHWSAPHG